MISLLAIWETYQRAHMPRLAPKTQAAYRSVMRRAVKALPANPTGPDVAAWFDGLRGKPVHKNYQLRVVQSVTKRGVELAGEGADILRAALAVKAPPAPPSARCMPPSDFVERTMGAAKNPAERAWIGVASRGPRKGEIMGLKPEDIGADGWITICRQRGRPHRKNRREYRIQIDAETLANLRWTIAHRDEVTPSYGRWNETPTSAGYIFPWGETYIDRFMGRVREHLGADASRYVPRGKAWHQFRRRMAKDSKDAGEQSSKTADRLGDKSEQMARLYADDGSMVNELPARRASPAVLAVRWIKKLAATLNGRRFAHGF